MKTKVLLLSLGIFFSNPAFSNDKADKYFKKGVAYLVGEELKHDVVRARSYLKRSADLGHVEASFYLGEMYLSGNGIKQSDIKAKSYFLKAANSEKGHPKSMYALGELYLKAGSMDKAKSMFFKSCSLGWKPACAK